MNTAQICRFRDSSAKTKEVAGLHSIDIDAITAIVSSSAYKLLAIAELLETPERAAGISYDAFSGIRIMLNETSRALFQVLEQETEAGCVGP